jgi:hypothetical protein
MIEWQAESSLFTLRVRGKQWYWVYKYEVKIITDILSTPKNIGNNKWVISNPLDLQVADDYLHIHQLRYQNQWLNNYWKTYLDTEIKDVVNHSSSSTSVLAPEISKFFTKSKTFKSIVNVPGFVCTNNLISDVNLRFNGESIFPTTAGNKFSEKVGVGYYQADKEQKFLKVFNRLLGKKRSFLGDESISPESKHYGWACKNLNSHLNGSFNIENTTPVYGFGHSESVESLRYAKRGQSLMTPLRIIKYPLNMIKNQKNLDFVELFRLRFNTEAKQAEPKVNPHQSQWIFKQKRYKRISAVKTKTRFYVDENGNLNKNIKFTYQPYVYKNRIVLNDEKNYYSHYQLFKKTKRRNEDIRLPFNKRLLRTKRIVVLPAHVNLTVITNSFDVVHSWFIPGLGLKMDCIPGRSTHHVLHIDHVGFYYGQCAEICGRYHHHMPIRICALPFEHFLVWWHSFGLPRLLKNDMGLKSAAKRYKYLYTSRKYVW